MHVFIQVRMSSKRLPGKVMMKVNNLRILDYLVDRLKYSNKYNIIITTSTNIEDDIIEKYCVDKKILYYRGNLNNVAKRIIEAAKKFECRSFVRVSGDSPLLDVDIIDRARNYYEKDKFDLVTNIFPRSYPTGQSVEIIRTSSLIKAYNKMYSLKHFEHVTPFFYENENLFKIKNFNYDKDLSTKKFTVDTKDDLNNFIKILQRMKQNHTRYSMEDLLIILDEIEAI